MSIPVIGIQLAGMLAPSLPNQPQTISNGFLFFSPLQMGLTVECYMCTVSPKNHKWVNFFTSCTVVSKSNVILNRFLFKYLK